jgi:microfibrillar-associated protein 1
MDVTDTTHYNNGPDSTRDLGSAGDGTESDNSGSSSDESGSETDSSTEVMMKPVFLSKSQRSNNPAIASVATVPSDPSDSSEHTSKLDKFAMQETTSKDLYDDIDDTDDLDPEAEYELWKQREAARFNRDREIIKQQEAEVQELLRREEMSEGELVKEFERGVKRKHGN